ncbi:LOW QUALITY PROTEIN: Fanconi anemia group M protein-like [Argopecten irradians]|uniref:LOW QUALITY PROTEIN: Fanconi anemia group M protein-like n=1 Tax=Argopecten irradians TaxID=31199 RepID=UPI003718C449
MNKGKQATLFQSWGAKKSKSGNNSVANNSRSDIHDAQPGPSSTTDHSDLIDLCDGLEDDDDEDLLAQAMEYVGVPDNNEPTADPPGGDVCNISLGAESFSGNVSFTQTVAPEGFDKFAGKTWIYPTNYPVRDYQFNICQQALYKNTMVTLPTGLGKTFIAAVVMYNFYRWYPQGKVVFMAPTKPLVAQQIEACYNIMGIPQSDTAEMTGNMAPTERKRTWQEKRVFFLTPQVLTNDLSRGTCPAVRVRCLVVDEAHKALGNHAYCQVVRELIKYTENFRILALSATPGSDIKAVQQVLSNLLISHIELRTEESIDIKQFSHERKVEKIVIPLGDELTQVKKTYIQVMDVVVGRLKRQGVLYKRETTSFSKFLILKAREAFRQNPPQQLQRTQYGAVEGDLALAMSLYHGFELLQLHGQRSLFNYLESIVSGEKGHGRTKTELMKNADFVKMMEKLRSQFAIDPNIRLSQKYKDGYKTGHPKMQKLEEVVVNHFDNFLKDGSVEEKSQATRVMIFSQYRDSVSEITDILTQHQPLVKVMSFIGQSSAGKATKGFTQKEQLKVMKQFREGGYNTLVSTCVGEEGLDIGEVDLIVCFDAHKSPIRLVQRMGRTGRKREGRIIMLVTEGKEEQIYNQSQYSKKSIHKAILNGAKSLHFYQNNPRMIPEAWIPSCHKMHITVKQNFQPKNGPKTGPKVKQDTKQSKIKFQSKSTAGVTSDDGLLTAEEYRDLIQNYSVPPDSLPILPKRLPLLALGEQHEPKPPGEKQILCEWLPWQNRLQDTYKIDHSAKTKNFVELMQFIEIQQLLDPNEDPYGNEMKLFLNKDDVLKPEETSSRGGTGIRKFCVSVEKGSEATSTIQKGKGKRVRKSEVLPVFEISSDEDSDDLPEFNINPNDKRSSVQGSVSKKGKKGKRLLTKHLPVLMDVPETEPVFRKSKKDKKRSMSGDKSVVQLIADTESRDFTDEEDMVPKVLPPLDEEMSDNKVEVKGDNRNEVEDMDLSDINYSPLEESDHDEMEIDDKKEESSFSQLLPNFPNLNISVAKSQSVDTTENIVCQVRTPPPLEQVGQIVADLDKCKNLPVLDLLQLVDEWDKESKEYCYQKQSNSGLDGSDSAGMRDHFDRGHSSMEERSPANDKSRSGNSGPGRKMSEPLKDIHIHKTHLSPPTITSESLKELEQSIPQGHQDDISDLECDHSDVEDGKGKLNSMEKESVDSKSSPSVSKAHTSLKNSGSDEEVVSDDSDIFMDTQMNFCLAENVDDGPFGTESKSCTTGDKLGKSPQNSVIDSKNKNGDSPVKEKHSDESSENDVFDTQANFLIKDDDIFGDADIEKDKADRKNDSSSSVSDQSRNTGDKEHARNMKSIRPESSNNQSEVDGKLMDKPKDVSTNFSLHKSKECTINNGSSASVGHKTKLTPVQVNKTPCRSADASLFDDSYDNEMLMALKTQRTSTVSPTQFTFTQALACVHDSNELVSENSEHFTDTEQKTESEDKLSENVLVEGNSRKEIHKSQDLQNNYDKNRNEKDAENLDQDLKQGSTNKDLQPNKNPDASSDESSKDSFDLPHFDLGFDVDEDIIPPSPCTSQSFSQKSFSASLSQSLLKSRKSLSTKFDSTCLTSANTSTVKLDKVGKDMSINKSDKVNKVAGIVGMSTIEEDSEEFSILNPVISRQGKTSRTEKSCSDFRGATKKSSAKMEDQNVVSGINLEEDFDDSLLEETQSFSTKPIHQQDDKPGINSSACKSLHSVKPIKQSSTASKDSVVVINKKKNHRKKNHNTSDSASDSTLSPNHDFMLKTSPLNVQTPVHTSSKPNPRTPNSCVDLTGLDTPDIDRCEGSQGFSPVLKESPDNALSPESDDDIIVRKKRRTVILLDSPASPVFSQSRRKSQITPFRTPYEPKEQSSLKKEKVNKSKFNVSFKLPNLDEFNADDEDDNDFADDRSILKRNKVIDSRPSRNKSSDVERQTVKRRTKSKSPADMFIHAEADVSDDEENVSDDEDDGSDMDQMEDSFIGEATQMSQGRAEDMHAFYLKSVRSPFTGGKFRLKYNHDKMDVFSQPQEYEDSHYIEDSFCVGDDFEETNVDFDEEVEDEVSVIQDPDVTYVGRRTRWSKPVAIKKKKVVKNMSGRKRIRKMSDSSSEEENKCNVSTVQTPRVPAVKRRGRVLLSSSTSDEECTVISPSKVISPGEDSQDIIPSLMTRIKNNKMSTGCISELHSKPESSNSFGPSKSCDPHDKQSGRSKEIGAWLNTSHQAADKSVSGLNTTALTAEQLRLQRLQKQKEKQEEFKKKLAEKAQMESQASESSVIQNSVNNSRVNNMSRLNCDKTDDLLLTSAYTYNDKKSVIFVDSREINGSQNIVSELRFKHNLSVIVTQLAGCDYVTSNRMGVDRKVWSEFTNGSNRAKLIDRIQQLCELYDRPCLIIESDPVKGSDKGNRLLHWTRYVDKTIVQLINSSVKLYFTAGQLDTAAILADLCILETRKNMAINVPVNISDKKQQHVKFYVSIPKLTYVHGLNLAHNFRTIKDFLAASVQAIRTKGCMSEKRAGEVYSYVRRDFDEQMLPTSYG